MELQDGVGRAVSIVTGGHFFSHYYLLAFPPLFPLIAAEFQLSNTELGGIVSAIFFPVLILQLPVGELVDRIGAKPVFVLGVTVTSFGILLAGFASSYVWLLGAALLSGIGQSTFHPADYTLLEAVVGDANEGKAFSVHTFGGYAGFAAAPVVIGMLGLAVGWRPALLLSGAAGLIYAAFSQIAMGAHHDAGTPDTAGESTGIRARMEVLFTPALLAITGLYLILLVIVTGIQSFTVVFVDQGMGLGTAVGNQALTSFTIGTAAGVLVGGPLADRRDLYRVTATAFLLCGACTILIATELLPRSGIVVLGLIGLIGLLFGIPLPARDRLVSAFAPEDATGRSFGLVFTGGYAGSFIAPLLLGAVIDLHSASLAFGIMGALFGLCIAIVIGLNLANR